MVKSTTLPTTVMTARRNGDKWTLSSPMTGMDHGDGQPIIPENKGGIADKGEGVGNYNTIYI